PAARTRMPCRTATAGAWRRAQRARTTATLHRLPQRVAASGIPLGRARKVASWQARLPSPTITRILYRLCRQGSTAPPLSKKRARRQSRQTQGREARGVVELHGGRGQMPTPRWASAHARPHESIVSVFCPHERTVRESSILRRCRILSNPSLFLGHSTPL